MTNYPYKLNLMYYLWFSFFYGFCFYRWNFILIIKYKILCRCKNRTNSSQTLDSSQTKPNISSFKMLSANKIKEINMINSIKIHYNKTNKMLNMKKLIKKMEIPTLNFHSEMLRENPSRNKNRMSIQIWKQRDLGS